MEVLILAILVGLAVAAVRARERQLAERGELLEGEAQRALEERVAAARRLLEGARRLLDQLPGPASKELGATLEQIDRALGGASLTERRQVFLGGLKKGELVWLPRYKQRCVVTRIDKAREQVTVRLGGMKLAVPFDDVTWCEA